MEPITALDRSYEQLQKVAAGVTPEQLSAPTPCGESNVRALLDRTLGVARRFTLANEGQAVAAPSGDVIGEDATAHECRCRGGDGRDQPESDPRPTTAGAADEHECAAGSHLADGVAGDLHHEQEVLLEVTPRLGLVERESTYSACMPALIEAAERDPQVREFHCAFSEERLAPLVDVLREAVATGELPPGTDPELIADALVGPIVMRRLMFSQPFDPEHVPALVDQVLPH